MVVVPAVSKETEFVLATEPPTSGQQRLAFAVVAVVFAVFVAAVIIGLTSPFALIPVRIDAFIPVLAALLFVNDFITAALLFGQFSIIRSGARMDLQLLALWVSSGRDRLRNTPSRRQRTAPWLNAIRDKLECSNSSQSRVRANLARHGRRGPSVASLSRPDPPNSLSADGDFVKYLHMSAGAGGSICLPTLRARSVAHGRAVCLALNWQFSTYSYTPASRSAFMLAEAFRSLPQSWFWSYCFKR
jgi:hypothetical protein